MHFPGLISSKLPQLQTTIFTRMSALAAEHGAINLAQGFPDFEPLPEVIQAVSQALGAGNHQYAPMAGYLPLREKIAEKCARLYACSLHPDSEITITAGGTQALFTAIHALIREGDEVLVFAPAYDSYIPAIETAGGKYVYYTVHTPDYCINWEDVKKLISPRTRMIILNNPTNPTGKVWQEEDLRQLAKLVAQTEIILLSDEVYEHMVFDEKRHESVLRYPELAERALCCFSFGKTYHVTGWKLGYVTGPAELMKEFRKIHQYNVFSVNSFLQKAFAELMEHPALYEDLSGFYQQKRDFARKQLQHPGLEMLPCEGTYFQLYRYHNISDERDIDFAKRLVTEYQLAVIPVSVFYPNQLDEKVIRICFAKKEETILRAAAQMQKIK